MSVIIRLQNLPWSANAGDIRTYFSGLSIPEGGVHIIGGEQGDAFIAFSTDEDARQAMQKDNGKLKEVQIKLFLSSRTEMLKVIEQARQAALKIHQLMNVPSTAATVPAPKIEAAESKNEDKRRSERSSSRSKGKEERRSRNRRDRDRRRTRSGSRSRSRDRSRDRYSRSRRSRSRERRRRSRDRDSKEPRNRNRDKEEQKKLPDPPAIPTQLLQMHQNGKEPSPTEPFGEEKKFPFQNQIAPFMPPFPQMQQIRPMPIPPIIDPSIIQRAMMQNPEMIQNYNFPMVPPVFQPPNLDPNFIDPWKVNPNQGNSLSTNLCIEIRGLPLNASYIDVKKLFDGLSIPSDGIKMINDTHGYRTGIAYVKFSNSNHKKLALNQNGKKVRSNTVEVIDLRDAIYQTAVDNFKPDKDVSFSSVDMDIENEEDKGFKETKNFRDFKTNWVMLRGLPSGSNERDVFDFFSTHNLSPLQVFFVVNNFGYSDAYARFLSQDDVEKAILISNPAYNRVSFAITKTTQEEADRLNPAFSDNQRFSRPFNSTTENRRPWRNDFNENRQEGRFRRNDFYERGRGRGRGRGRFMGNGRPDQRQPSPQNDNVLESFAKRGTIVSLENIHFKADLEEILEFFQGFDLEQEHILRRFDDLGRPTGDARVALKSYDDAIRAVKELNFKPIRGRTVRLQILQN